MRKPISLSFRNLSSKPLGDTDCRGEAVVNTKEMTMTLDFKQSDGERYTIKGKANGIGTFEGKPVAYIGTPSYKAEWRQLNECTYTGIWEEDGYTWLFTFEVEEL